MSKKFGGNWIGTILLFIAQHPFTPTSWPAELALPLCPACLGGLFRDFTAASLWQSNRPGSPFNSIRLASHEPFREKSAGALEESHFGGSFFFD
jgi:hypothetical protein